MTRCTAYVLVSVMGVILIFSIFWVTGTPFKRSANPLKWYVSSEGRPSSCQCSQPHHCRDFITLKSSTDTVPACDNGEVCCQSLKQATAYEDAVNGVVPSEPDEDVGGEDDTSEEEEDDWFTDSGKGSEDDVPPTVVKKFTEEYEDDDVVDLDDLVGSTDAKPVEFKCGVATSHLIIDDKQAADPETTRLGQYPWTLVLLYTESGTTVASCGATLIQPKYAITAAHCVADKDIKNFVVRAGEWDLNKEDETFAHEDRTIKSMVTHEKFQKYGLHNDIAFIELSSKFELSPHIGKLCVPDKKESVKKKCIATGWGMQGDVVSPSTQSKMKSVEVELESGKVCQEKLRKTDLGPNFHLSNSSLCGTALRKGEDTSIGDGGGPLFCLNKDSTHFTFVGIVSWGKLQYPDAPGVYTAVKNFREWIDEQIRNALGM